MISIGVHGDILPNTVGWCLTQANRNFGNITKIVMSALSTALDACVLMGLKNSTYAGLEHTQTILRTACTKAMAVFVLKQKLLKVENISFNGVKFHALCCHMYSSAHALGMPTYMDTQAFEHEHIEDGVNAYKRTSKRKETTTREMLLHALQMKRAAEIYHLSELNDLRNGIGSESIVQKNQNDETRYIALHNSALLQWDLNVHTFLFINKSHEGMLHHTLSLKLIYTYIMSYYEEEGHTWETILENNTFALEHGVRVLPDSISGHDNFLIISTSKYQSGSGNISLISVLISTLSFTN